MKTTTKSKYTQPQLHQRKPNVATIGGIPAALKHIEHGCEALAEDRRVLAKNIATLNNRIASIRLDYMPEIRKQADEVAHTRGAIHFLIETNRALFEKPKTRTFADIKVGLQKQKGSIVIKDEAKTLALIALEYPEKIDVLAPMKRTISKAALNNLTGAELKKLAVEIEADTDEVIIKPQDSDVEKAVAALLAETQQPELKAAA